LGVRAKAFWALFGVIGAISSVLVMRRPAFDRLADLHVYYGAARAVQSGQPLYAYAAGNGDPFTYPPFAILVLWPIGWLREGAVQVGWLIATCLAVLALASAVAGRRDLVPIVACGLIVSAPIQSNLRFGQVSVFIVLLALVDAVGLTPQRFRGVLVGVAAAIKLTPLLFVVFFLLSKRHREAVRAAGAFIACFLLAALALPRDSLTFWTDAVFTTSRIGDLAALGNQSVHGLLLRAGVAPAALPLLWATLVAAICAAGLWRARGLALSRQPRHAAVLVGCATVAASPVSWTHHQIWPVLAAMILMGTTGAARKAAGALLLAVMTVSLGALLAGFSITPGLQFLFENARALAAIVLCVAGFGGVAFAVARRRTLLRVLTTSAAALALFAVLPLPAQADPSFKAYSRPELANPRYFFACAGADQCAHLGSGPIAYGLAFEPTKSRVSGVVSAAVARLEYRSAPGGPPREIPLIELYPGQRAFAFRCANLASGQLIAYDASGRPLEVIAPAHPSHA
jgi:alpha-1,2-mannosyltransferase